MTETSTRYERYFLKNTKEIRYRDPVFDQELGVCEPPPSLSSNPITKTGLAYLKKMSQSHLLTIQLVWGCHGNATDFSDMVQASGNALSDTAIVASELSWRTTNIETPELSTTTIDQPGSVGPKEFHDNQISWLSQRGKIILPCDLPSKEDDHGQPYQSYRELLKQCWKNTKSYDEYPDPILWGVFQTVREWMWLAHLGYWLADLEKTGVLPQGKLKIPFISGLFHTGLAKKLDNLGIPHESYTVTTRTEGELNPNDPQAELFHFTTTNTVIPQQQLTELLAKLTKPSE